MSVTMSQVCVPVFVTMLSNLKGLLEKGVAHAAATDIKDEVMVAARLYPNMLPLSNQVQIACDTAKRAVSRLSGVSSPVNEDNESSMAELIARISSTLEFIKSVPSEQIDGTEDKPVELKLPNTTLNFTGLDYLTSFALPNFLFHTSIAHGILRSYGVPIGKKDFLGAPRQD